MMPLSWPDPADDRPEQGGVAVSSSVPAECDSRVGGLPVMLGFHGVRRSCETELSRARGGVRVRLQSRRLRDSPVLRRVPAAELVFAAIALLRCAVLDRDYPPSAPSPRQTRHADEPDLCRRRRSAGTYRPAEEGSFGVPRPASAWSKDHCATCRVLGPAPSSNQSGRRRESCRVATSPSVWSVRRGRDGKYADDHVGPQKVGRRATIRQTSLIRGIASSRESAYAPPWPACGRWR